MCSTGLEHSEMKILNLRQRSPGRCADLNSVIELIWFTQVHFLVFNPLIMMKVSFSIASSRSKEQLDKFDVTASQRTPH